MRIVFVGAGDVAVMTARALLAESHEVVIIESDKERIDEVSQALDCSFLHGDGSKPAILSEVGPHQTDVLFCISNDDKANIIASLVGRSLGFKRVITSISDPDLEEICRKLELEDTLIPHRTISRHLQDMVHGLDNVELSTLLRADARFFTFTAGKDDAIRIEKLDLPDDARVIFYYRQDTFHFADADSKLEEGDEVVILTHRKNLQDLRKRWLPRQAEDRIR
jgi:trk system potassium uptake protein TrkA